LGRTQKRQQPMASEISNRQTLIYSWTQSMHQIIAFSPMTRQLCYILQSYTRTHIMNHLYQCIEWHSPLILKITAKTQRFIIYTAKVNLSSVHHTCNVQLWQRFSVLTTENSAESPTPTPIQKSGDLLEI